jgi:hypothetical protein
MATNVKTNSNSNAIETYFEQNDKFFGVGDINAKKGFFCLGMYARRVNEGLEKEIAEKGTETPEQAKFLKRFNREISMNMNYRAFTIVVKLLDEQARKTNPKLFNSCSQSCKQYIINSDMISDKKSISPADANLAFSLGMYQK